jgi:hypothetical protein
MAPLILLSFLFRVATQRGRLANISPKLLCMHAVVIEPYCAAWNAALVLGPDRACKMRARVGLGLLRAWVLILIGIGLGLLLNKQKIQMAWVPSMYYRKAVYICQYFL